MNWYTITDIMFYIKSDNNNMPKKKSHGSTQLYYHLFKKWYLILHKQTEWYCVTTVPWFLVSWPVECNIVQWMHECDRVLLQDQQRKGVIVATDSSFSMAVAFHAVELRIPVFVIMPACSSPPRLRMYRDYGAMVISYGSTARDSISHARHLARENGYLCLEEWVHQHSHLSSSRSDVYMILISSCIRATVSATIRHDDIRMLTR